MIELRVNLSSQAPAKLRRFARAMPQMMRIIYMRAALQAAGEFEKRQLTGRTSRTSGLNRITGRTLAGSIMASSKAQPIQEGNVVFGLVGFLDKHSARIANVHEKGTVGAGGTLADIIPSKKKKFLRFKVSSIAVSKTTGKARRKWSGWIFAKRVAIPPRLRFFETMKNRIVVHKTQKAASNVFNTLVAKIFQDG